MSSYKDAGTLAQEQNAYECVRILLRRAFRLRRWPDAIAAVRLCPAGADAEDVRYTVLAAAEEALVGRSRADALANWLLLHAISERAAELNLARRDSAAWLADLPGFERRRDVLIRNEEHESPIKPEPLPPADEAQLTITVRSGTLTEQVDRAEQALTAAEFGLYQRGGEIVRVAFVPTADGRESLQVAPVDETHLAELMGRAAAWWRYDARSKVEVPTRCPPDVPRAYMSRGSREWRLPHLAGVIDAPSLRADGSVIYIPGHDVPTGLLLATETEAFPRIPSKPDHFDACEAADALTELLAEFPFVADEDQSVAVAAILTAVVRRALPAAPLFGFTAPAPGTGKSCLVDIIHMIASGRPASAMTWTGDPAEDRKQLDAALLDGAAAIAFDNVNGVFGGDRLNQILTQPRASVRVLGQSRNVEVACQAFVTANGNNLTISADMTRRTVLCRLDAGVERPELRAFTSDPLAMIRVNRGRYVVAALTILRAYHVAGRPGQPKPLGSFEAWSSWVRGAVMWCGFADPVATMDAVRENDPARSDHLAILEQWNLAFGDMHVSTADIIARASVTIEFREALLSVAGAGGAINTHRLGLWLRAVKGRLVGTMKLDPAGRRRGGVRLWALRGGREACSADVLPMIRPEELTPLAAR